MGVSLQAFECHATVAIVLLVTFVLAGFDTLAGATFFLGHATLRMYGSLLKMPHRKWNDLLIHPTIAGACAAGLIRIILG